MRLITFNSKTKIELEETNNNDIGKTKVFKKIEKMKAN